MIRYYTYTSIDDYPSDYDPQFTTKEQAMIDINIHKQNYETITLWHVLIDSDTFIHMDKVCKVSKMSNGTYSWLWYI
jgi:hypothetical protein